MSGASGTLRLRVMTTSLSDSRTLNLKGSHPTSREYTGVNKLQDVDSIANWRLLLVHSECLVDLRDCGFLASCRDSKLSPNFLSGSGYEGSVRLVSVKPRCWAIGGQC